MFKLIILLLIGIGWVAFSTFTSKFVKDIVAREVADEKQSTISYPSLVIDLLFLAVSFYGFYNNIVRDMLSEIALRTNYKVISMIYVVVLLPYLSLTYMGYAGPVLYKYMRYYFAILVLYGFILTAIYMLVSGKSIYFGKREIYGIRQLSLSFIDLYSWYFVVLFPFEIGIMARRIRVRMRW